MKTRTPNLSSILREVVVPARAAGQVQSAESIERDKGFAERSAQMAKLRALRLQQAAPADVAPPRRKRAPK
ncbi:MAG TPA: hypothetical protein VG742_13940 [Dongiaceae bacterium]|nr:hypothetical protein [Dongiaceae bacterium]